MEKEQVSKASICPSCGGILQFDVMSGKLACNMCGSYFRPGIIDILKGFKVREEEHAADADDTKREIICDSCGAVVIADEHTSASFCAFCGSPSLIANRLRNEFKPDLIIPFKIDKKEATEIFYQWAKDYPYAPRDFTSERTVSKITGLYVPFWLINSTCIATLGGAGFRYDNINPAAATSRMVYSIERQAEFGLKNVPFDASKRINDRLMESIEPFDYKEIVEYRDSYIPGFYAERYDTNALEMSDRIYDRLDGYARDVSKTIISGYTESTLQCEKVELTDLTQNYALLPVWFLNYRYKGINYSFAINGQTGKASGNIPDSTFRVKFLKYRRYLPWILGTAGAVALLILTFKLASQYELIRNIMMMLVFILYVVVTLFMSIKINHTAPVHYTHDYDRPEKRKPIQSIADAPGVELYYDSTHKADIDGKDTFVMLQRKVYSNAFNDTGTYHWE